MCVYLIDGPAAHTEAAASLFAEGEGLIVVTTVIPEPRGDATIGRRLAVYRTLGAAPDYAAFAGWDDEIDRADDICDELWADGVARYQPVDGAEPGGDETGEVILRLTERQAEWA